MRRLVNILCILVILVLFLLLDFKIISRVFAVSGPPSALTSWVRALPLQPAKRSMYIEWMPVAGATGYRLRYTSVSFVANTPNGTYTSLYDGTTTSYIHNNLSDNNWYVYWVQAYDATNNSSWFPTNGYGVGIQPAGLKWEETY